MPLPYQNSKELSYPLTKMNFIVQVSGVNAVAAFSEVTGVEASVDVVEFRQGNAHSLSPVKVPGLVKHGNVTLKFGYTLNSAFKTWIKDCVSSTRTAIPRRNVQIEMIDITVTSPQQPVTTASGKRSWILTDAWVTKYSAPDLNALQSEIAIESVELAYEELEIPN